MTPCYDPQTWECNFEANGYRLPTEAEWEYACRAGTTTRYYFGDRPEELKAHAWFEGNAQSKPHPVGHFAPNPWGLYDMTGNVQEWCNDFYGAKYYRTSPEENPRGPQEGEKRVLRGGAWSSQAENCAAWARKLRRARFHRRLPDHGLRRLRCARQTRPHRRRAYQQVRDQRREAMGYIRTTEPPRNPSANGVTKGTELLTRSLSFTLSWKCSGPIWPRSHPLP